MTNARKNTKIQRSHAAWSIRINIYIYIYHGVDMIYRYIYNTCVYVFILYINDKYKFIYI